MGLSILKNDSLFIRNSDRVGHPVFYLAALEVAFVWKERHLCERNSFLSSRICDNMRRGKFHTFLGCLYLGR